ncbi:MAG TPA: hypothetical protein VMI54_10930 [Polyangiaceae bacterium]|nr:hypothetical protein [Polyangiaceae bacterium]
MNINSVSSTDQISPLTQLTGGSTTSQTDSTPPPGIGDAAVAHMSGPSKLMSKLAALKADDPTKFQSVVSDMASKLKAEAAQVTGPQAQFLTNLSNKLSDIANGGDISELRGPAGGGQAGGAQGVHHGGHHHHHGGGGGGVGSSTSSSSSSDSSDSVHSVVESIFGELDAALNGQSSTGATAST